MLSICKQSWDLLYYHLLKIIFSILNMTLQIPLDNLNSNIIHKSGEVKNKLPLKAEYIQSICNKFDHCF